MVRIKVADEQQAVKAQDILYKVHALIKVGPGVSSFELIGFD